MSNETKKPAAKPVNDKISEKEKQYLLAMCEKAGVKPEEFFHNGIDNLEAKHYTGAITKLQGIIDQKGKK